MLCAKNVSKAGASNFHTNCWHMDLCFRNIKTTLMIETLSCKTPDMVEKELLVYLLAYNIIGLLMS